MLRSFFPEPPSRPEVVVFPRQQLAKPIRWVWLAGWAIPILFLTGAVITIDIFVLDLPAGTAPITTIVLAVAVAISTTIARYRNWAWELDSTELIIDRGVVFKLTRVVPRVRVQHVDISSGPIDRFFGLRQISIYTAGTREADARLPGLTASTAEELRRALIQH